jgi:hypothetical protein
MSYKQFFYFDIETTSKSQSIFDLNLDDEKGYDLFIKKCETMKKIDAGWNKSLDEIYIDKAPLIPEYGKIICMSFGMFTDEGQKKIMTIIENDEEVMMRRIAKIFTRSSQTRRSLCGYNIKNFDIPFIFKKMFKYDIDLPSNLNFSALKPWELNIHDLSDIWRGIGKSSASLEEVTYDLELPIPKRIMGGEDVHDFYWGKKDTKSIISKCEQDVESTILVAEKLKL